MSFVAIADSFHSQLGHPLAFRLELLMKWQGIRKNLCLCVINWDVGAFEGLTCKFNINNSRKKQPAHGKNHAARLLQLVGQALG
jgi:hypothetical protein